MLWSGLLIHLTGGRIETHFHIFGSLAFLAFYRDWRVLATATAIVVADHLLRGIFWPYSVYGVASAGIWRTFEHGFWVIFEDIFLAVSIRQTLQQSRAIAINQARLEQRHFSEIEAKNRDLEQAYERLKSTNARLLVQVNKVESVHQQLMEASRRSGMAEIATGVLHNVGNVLNSVNVSTGLVMERLRRSPVDQLARVSGMIEQHRANLGQFVTQDAKGRQIPDFLKLLSGNLTAERADILEEVEDLASKVDHIKTIVAAQHSYAGVAGVIEPTDLSVLLDDGLKINMTAFLERHRVQVEYEYADLPPLLIDKQKVLQIVVNLVKNAKGKQCSTRAAEDLASSMLAKPDLPATTVFKSSFKIPAPAFPQKILLRYLLMGLRPRKPDTVSGYIVVLTPPRKMGGSLRAYSDGPGTERDLYSRIAPSTC